MAAGSGGRFAVYPFCWSRESLVVGGGLDDHSGVSDRECDGQIAVVLRRRDKSADPTLKEVHILTLDGPFESEAVESVS